jgi:hypothetical protein
MSKKPQREPKDLSEARAVAREVVRKHWPELANVEPVVSERAHDAPHPSDIKRLGVQTSAARRSPATEYTFTFATEVRTPEGFIMPRVARITVDSQRRVVKTVMSK